MDQHSYSVHGEFDVPIRGSVVKGRLKMLEGTSSSACLERDQWHKPLSLDVASHMHQLQWSDQQISSDCKAFGWTSGVGASLRIIKTMQHRIRLPNIPEIPILIAKARAMWLASPPLPFVYMTHERTQICFLRSLADSEATELSISTYK